MLTLDHLTVIAPTLREGVDHVRACLGLDVPSGTRHDYMGTHNHWLQLGDGVYLEIVARDPDGADPKRSRWFGLDDEDQVRSDWDAGRRLRGWVAATTSIEALVDAHLAFGEVVGLPPSDPVFAFAIPRDGSLPFGGALPSLIDHWENPTSVADIPDLGARLRSFTLEHPEPDTVASLYRELRIDRPPEVWAGEEVRYRAIIETDAGSKVLT